MWRDKSIGEGLAFKDADSKKGIVTGYFSRFGNKDSDGDVMVQGAYARTIKENGPGSAKPRIKYLLDHDITKAIGPLTVLKEDNFGLYYEGQCGRHTLGRDFILMVEDGIITEHSVRFYTEKYEYDEASRAWRILDVTLKEGSALQCWGANDDTPVTGIKSFKLDTVIEKMTTLQKALRSGKYSDETFLSIEKKFDEMQQLLKTEGIQKEESKTPGLSLGSLAKAIN